MWVTMVRSKIHRVRITDAQLDYVGSITIDSLLMDAVGLHEGEKVQVVNVNNGERLETYTMRGEPGSGTVCLNGPAARKALMGDLVIIIAYGLVTDEQAPGHRPKVVFPDEHNRLRS